MSETTFAGRLARYLPTPKELGVELASKLSELNGGVRPQMPSIIMSNDRIFLINHQWKHLVVDGDEVSEIEYPYFQSYVKANGTQSRTFQGLTA